MYKISSVIYEPTDRIDFAFVLLPDHQQAIALLALRDDLHNQLELLSDSSPQQPTPHKDCRNAPVNLPHVSLGHYALLAEEIVKLKDILDKKAQQFSRFQEEMKPHIHVSDYNVSLEALNTKEKTNPRIIKLYKILKTDFFDKIITKQATLRANHHKIMFKDQPKELELLEQFYQNWNTPEGNRMRIHFTLAYSHVGKEHVTSYLTNLSIPEKLGHITLTHLGIVAIDLNGNPLKNGLIHVAPLM